VRRCRACLALSQELNIALETQQQSDCLPFFFSLRLNLNTRHYYHLEVIYANLVMSQCSKPVKIEIVQLTTR
jgi:hypothetical protein